MDREVKRDGAFSRPEMEEAMKVWMTRIAKSKTLLFSLAISVLSVLQASMDVFTAYISPQGMGFVMLAVGVVIAVLRVLTTQDIKDK